MKHLQRHLIGLGAAIAVSAGNLSATALAKEIGTAFGVTLGQKFSESKKTSDYVKSKRYPGALHAYIRPVNPHPYFDVYRAWVTSQTKTVVAIHAYSSQVNNGFNYIGPNEHWGGKRERRWKREHHQAILSFRDMFLRWREKWREIGQQLDGLYKERKGKSTETPLIYIKKRYYHEYLGMGGTNNYYDDTAKLVLKLRCLNTVKLRNENRRTQGCLLEILYELKALKQMVARESTETKGL